MDIVGMRIHVRGRAVGLSGRHIASLLEWRGASPARRLSSADLCVIAHSCAATWGDGSLAVLEVPIMSELSFRRVVGLIPSLPAEPRPYAIEDMAAHSGLPVEAIRDLAIFDVLDGPDAFGFRDIAVAREARRLLEGGTPLVTVLQTGAALRSRGVRLNTAALGETPWGGLATIDGDDVVAVDGQMELQLGEPRLRFEDVFDVAEECETEGDLEEAERLYRLAAKLDRRDGCSLFNLGNVLVALGRPEEAMTAFLSAAGRDRELAADACYNVAIIHRRRGSDAQAEAAYLAALRADPGHGPARHNLALLMASHERYAEAMQIWDALATEGDSTARRQAALCRMELMNGARHRRDAPISCRSDQKR